MSISRREALSLSGSTLAGLSLAGLVPADLQAQTQQPAEPWRITWLSGRSVRAFRRRSPSTPTVPRPNTQRALPDRSAIP